MEQKMMKAAVLTGPQQLTIKQVPVPEPKPGEIVIKVSACGVCGSDVHMWKAGKGWGGQDGDFWMGHEFCGVVTDPGDSRFKKGDRVTFWANLYCGECDMCLAGQEQICREVNGTNYIGFVCNGAYAEYYVGKASNAYLLPDTVSDVAAGLIDPLMVAYHAIHRSGIQLHDRVLVVGSGIIGQLIGELAKKAGASYVDMSKVSDIKTKHAREIGVFDEYFDGNDPKRTDVFHQATNGGFDIAFEAVGADAALAACVDGVRPGGKIVMIGNSIAPEVSFAMNRAVLQEMTLIGSVSCTRKEFEETIDLIAGGMIDPEKYVTEVLPLEGLQQALERQIDPNDPMVKFVIRP